MNRQELLELAKELDEECPELTKVESSILSLRSNLR